MKEKTKTKQYKQKTPQTKKQDNEAAIHDLSHSGRIVRKINWLTNATNEHKQMVCPGLPTFNQTTKKRQNMNCSDGMNPQYIWYNHCLTVTRSPKKLLETREFII